jgi:histidine triad (HIT) family protein
MTCVFCVIVDGQLPSSKVHEDEVCLAFMNLSPVTDGHTLVTPKTHDGNLTELPTDIGAHLWTITHRIGRALLRSPLRGEGVNVTMANGEAAGQDVFHAHLHVFPRYSGDSYRVRADWRQRGRAELDTAAGKVRAALTSRT